MWCNQYGTVQKWHFYEPTTYKTHFKTSSEQIIDLSRHEYGRVGVFRIKMKLSVHTL